MSHDAYGHKSLRMYGMSHGEYENASRRIWEWDMGMNYGAYGNETWD